MPAAFQTLVLAAFSLRRAYAGVVPEEVLQAPVQLDDSCRGSKDADVVKVG